MKTSNKLFIQTGLGVLILFGVLIVYALYADKGLFGFIKSEPTVQPGDLMATTTSFVVDTPTTTSNVTPEQVTPIAPANPISQDWKLIVNKKYG